MVHSLTTGATYLTMEASMDSSIIATIITATVTSLGILFAYSQWRRDVNIKLGQVREDVSVELIRQRIEPYAAFMRQLEILSTLYHNEIQQDTTKTQAGLQAVQEAVYGNVGLLASHNTRQVLLYVRVGLQEFMEGKITSGELTLRLWSLHFALRGDVGIRQPEWPSEVERIHIAASRNEDKAFVDLMRSYPWTDVDFSLKSPHKIKY